MLASHDAATKDSRKAQRKSGRLVNKDRHTAHTASLDQLPEMARSPGPDVPLGARETKVSAKARYRSLQGAGVTAFLRARSTDSLTVILAAEFVGLGNKFVRVKEHVATRSPRCDAADVDSRQTRICPRAGAQVNQHQPLLRAISSMLKQLGIPH